ncbi:MAG: Capsule polysaccharide biosynthesis protein [Chloroflexi bacterium]|nr:MAG: Capsule polysaccharide biosynthesis protein [Chloroflexota bacterium]
MQSSFQKLRRTLQNLETYPLYRKLRRRVYGKRSSSWYPHLRKLFDRDIRPELDQVSAVENRRVLFWTPTASWPHILLEYFLATTLRLEGWQAKFAFCDGDLPHCELERSNTQRPNCTDCWQNAQRAFSPFDVPYWKLSDFVTQDEIKEVTETAASMDIQALREWEVDGYKAGAFADLYLPIYFLGHVREHGERELGVMRRVAAANVLGFRYAQRVLEAYKPEAVVMINGNLSITHSGFAACLQANVRVFTWEDFRPYQDSFIFAQGQPAVFSEIPDEVWSEAKERSLSPGQEREVATFLERFAYGRIGDIVYHPNPERGASQIQKRLNIDPDRPLFAVFTNTVWDSSVLGRNVGFKSMMDWVIETCDWFVNRPDMQLIVRVHPGEARLPGGLRTVVGAAQVIREHFNDDVPPNIILVDATDDAFSYTLAQMADGIGVYTSSLGFELASLGRRVWVAGKVHYRGRGFTLDVRDREHLYQLLEDYPWDSILPSQHQELAKRYVYVRYFRQSSRVPFLTRIKSSYATRPYFKDFRFLMPGKDPLLSALAARVKDGKPVMDLPQKSAARWKSI